MATALYDAPLLRSFILREAEGQLSRDNVVVTLAGDACESGQVLTQAGDAGAASFAVDVGKTGNPTSSAIVVTYPAKPGKYTVKFNSATLFEVEDPAGVLVGTGALGSPFSAGGLAFTLTAGGTPAVEGTTAKITVAPGDGKYVPYAAGGAAGPADAILYERLPAGSGDFPAVAITCKCEVNRHELTGLDFAAELALRKLGILVRS